MAKERYYAAYGSNLSLEQMAYRCPQAKMVGTGTLEHYELQFRGSAGRAHATVEPCAGKEVPILLWSLNDRDEQSLDRYDGYPSSYKKTICPIVVNDTVYEAMLYEMQPGHALNIPSPQYFQTIRDGYEMFDFPLELLEKALMKSVMPIYEKPEETPELDLKL